MKKLLALLAVLGFVSYAHAGDGTEFSQSGEYRVQYQHDMNKDFDSKMGGGGDNAEMFHQRLRWGANWRVGEKMTAHLTMVHNANWGDNASQVPNTVTTGAAAGSGVANTMTVQEAYGTWMATDSVAIKYGRGSVTMADGRFISANSYENVNNAFDGVLVHWDHEMFKFGFFGVRAANSNLDAGTTNDNNVARFYGVSADWKTAPDFLKTVHLHYVTVKADEGDYAGAASSIPNEDSVRMGVAVAGDRMGIDYRANYEAYTGKRKTSAATASGLTKQDISASMMDAEVGYSMPSMMGMRVHAGYHTDTGSKVASSGTGANDQSKDQTYQGFFYDRHDNGGLMGLLSWGNLTYTTLGVSLNVRDDVSVAANYFMYEKTDAKDDNYNSTGKFVGNSFAGSNNVAIFNATAAGSDKELGNELDLVATKKYTNNFSITAHYAMFNAGKVVKDNSANGKNDTETEYYLESRLTF